MINNLIFQHILWFKMSRSVKDLRELINISRLSFHGDDQPHKIDERDEISEHDLLKNGESSHEEEQHSKRIKSTKDIELSKTSLRTSRFKPLPAISSSKAAQKPAISKAKQDTDLLYQKSCNCILENIDASFISSWLQRSNESVQWLSDWVSTKDHFVRFAKFWLGEMDREKQGDLIELEVGIILDEITCSVQDGITFNKVSQQDVMSFFLLIIWEYPSRICGPQNSVFVLNTLTTLASGRKDKYRRLLSNVKFATKDPSWIHWILSVRAFALISIVTALVKFYSSLMQCGIPHQGTGELGTKLHSKSVQDFAFDAVRLGFLEVLIYLVKENDLGISALKNNDETTLLFYAVTCSQVEIIQYILKVCILIFFL